MKENTEGDYDYSHVAVQIPEEIAEKIMEFGKTICDEQLYEEEDDASYGREDDIHVTVLYGIHDTDADGVTEVVSDIEPGTLKFEDISFFDTDKGYRVMKIDIDSFDLHMLNQKIRKDVEYTTDFPDYHPHCTIGYVKDTYDDSELDKSMFNGIEVPFDTVRFNSSDKSMGSTDIPLN